MGRPLNGFSVLNSFKNNKEIEEKYINLIKNSDIKYMNSSHNNKKLKESFKELGEKTFLNSYLKRKLIKAIFLLKNGASRKEVFKDFLIVLDCIFCKSRDKKTKEKILKELEDFKIKNFNKLSIREFNFICKTILEVSDTVAKIKKTHTKGEKTQIKKLLKVLKTLKNGKPVNRDFYESVKNVTRYLGNINENKLKNIKFRISLHDCFLKNIEYSCSFFNENFNESDYQFMVKFIYDVILYSDYFVNENGFFVIPNEIIKNRTKPFDLEIFLEAMILYYIIKAIFEISDLKDFENFKEIKIIDFWNSKIITVSEKDVPDEIKKITKQSIITAFSDKRIHIKNSSKGNELRKYIKNVPLLDKLIIKLKEDV